MNTRKIAVEYRLSHWAGIMQERTESGMNIKTFCEHKGFHENIYYYWQRKLREAACRELIPANNRKVEKSIVPKGWATCEISAPEPNTDTVSIEVGKFKMTVGANSSPVLLDKVCRILGALC